MNIDLLEALVAVAEEGGYARAARVLNLSQPAVYQRIQRLETSVGSAIVQKDGRRIRLTPRGQVIYFHARQVMQQLRLLSDAVEEGESPMGGSLSVLVGHSLGEFPVPDICFSFQREHPDLAFDLRVSARPPRDIDRDIREGRSDVGMHSDPTLVKGLVKDAFYEEQFVAIAYPGHRFENLDIVTPEDFRGEEVIPFRDVTYAFSEGATEGWFAHAGIEIHPRLVSNSLLTIRALVERAAGVSIVPREHAVQSSTVVIRPLEKPPTRRHYFVTRVTPYENANVRALRSYVLSGSWMRESMVLDVRQRLTGAATSAGKWWPGSINENESSSYPRTSISRGCTF